MHKHSEIQYNTKFCQCTTNRYALISKPNHLVNTQSTEGDEIIVLYSNDISTTYIFINLFICLFITKLYTHVMCSRVSKPVQVFSYLYLTLVTKSFKYPEVRKRKTYPNIDIDRSLEIDWRMPWYPCALPINLAPHVHARACVRVLCGKGVIN